VLYNINLLVNGDTNLRDLGVTLQTVILQSSMDSMFPQLEFTFATNEDIVGKGFIRFGSQITLQIFNNSDAQIVSLPFSIYNIELVKQTVKYSTVGSIRVSCVYRWYFQQTVASLVYYGTPSDAIFSILTREAEGQYTQLLIQKSINEISNIWYRCNLTAMKFIKTVLEPNLLIDESPTYLFANDLGEVVTESYLTMSRRTTPAVLVDPSIASYVTSYNDESRYLLGYTDFKLSMGSEYAWQSLAQRLICLSEGYQTLSGGVEPSSYLNPDTGELPPILCDLSLANYSDPYSGTQTVLDDSANSLTNIRAKFLNTYRKKGLESFKLDIACDNDFRLTVGSSVRLKLTSLPQGNPSELAEIIAANELLYGTNLDDSLYSGLYFIKNMKRVFQVQPGNAQYFANMTINIVKFQ